MSFADPNVFDESEDLGVPLDSRSDVGDGQDGGHSRVRRRPVREHPATLDRRGHPRPGPLRRGVLRWTGGGQRPSGARRRLSCLAEGRATRHPSRVAKGTAKGARPMGSLDRPRVVPIGDYGFLSDGEVSALVAPSGSVDWMCLPRFDSPSVLGAVLGRRAGSFTVAPLGIRVPADRRYLPGTMILETSWGTPTGYEAEHVLLRTIRCVSGEVQAIMDCEPVLDYGQSAVAWIFSGDSHRQGRAEAAGSDVTLTLTTDMLLGFEGGQASARTLLKEGDTRFVALSWGSAVPPETFEDAYQRLVWTAHHWQHWLDRGTFPDHPWRSYLQRSALTLRGLTYAPTGAVMAASTTSLPETPGGNRNYDYRFTWIRDATFALWGMHSLGFDWEALDFFSFIADVAELDDDLQIMYGIGGESALAESTLEHLPGYADSRPVRIGNAAHAQKQHDVWGALLDSVYLHSKAVDHLDNRIWPILEKQVGQALKHWQEPDAGIWEVRGELRHFTSSKIMCWVAVDRGARLALMYGESDKAAEWNLAAAEIKEDILAKGVDDRGVFTQYYGSTALED